MSSFGPHLVGGIVAGGIGTGVAFGILPDPWYICCTPMIAGICGALTPDMDIKSKSSQCMYLLFAGLAFYLWYIGRYDLTIITLAYAIFPQFFKHRGFIHSIIFGIASTGLLYYILNQMLCLNMPVSLTIGLTYLFGFTTHLILDET